MALKCVAVFGACGLEGELLLTAIAEPEFGIDLVKAFADDADGETVMYRGRPVVVNEPSSANFSDIDVAIFLNEGFSDFAVIDAAEDAGVIILDCTDTLAQRGDVPVFCKGVPVDADLKSFAIADAVSSHVAAFLRLLPAATSVRDINVAVSQPVSVFGRAGVETLAAETARLLNGQPPEDSQFGLQMAFNVLSRSADKVAALEHSLGVLMAANGASVNVTVFENVVPVFYGHTVMLRVGCHQEADISGLKQQLVRDDRFRLFPQDDIVDASPINLQDSETIDISALSSGRQDETVFRCTLVGDNLRQGSVFNIIALLKNLIKINI